MRDFLNDRGPVNEYNHLCRLRQGPESNGRTLDSDRIQHASPSESSHQKQDRSTVESPSSQNPLVSNVGGSTSKSWNQNTSTTQTVQTRQQQPPHIAISLGGVNESVVLFGVKGPRITLELAQIDAVKHGKDNLFFLNLREEYKQRRGRLRYWLSVWKLSHCDFVKVRSNSMSTSFQCLLVPV